jgi:uncharacterized protein (TIGR02300 family)
MSEVKLGNKYICFNCGVKFYDLGKGEAVCPKCGANQKDSDAQERPVLTQQTAKRKRKPDPKPKAKRAADAEEEELELDDDGDDEEIDEDLDDIGAEIAADLGDIGEDDEDDDEDDKEDKEDDTKS